MIFVTFGLIFNTQFSALKSKNKYISCGWLTERHTFISSKLKLPFLANYDETSYILHSNFPDQTAHHRPSSFFET